MWMVDPRILCTQHLLGEHVETHMFVGHLLAGRKLGKYAALCETSALSSRHDALVVELLARGYKHNSPLPEVPKDRLGEGSIDRAKSLLDLTTRCALCAARYRRLK